MNYLLKTFGCQMNYADSEKINMVLLQGGLRKVLECADTDIVLLNTCSVRQKGEDRVYGYIREARALAHKNGKRLIVGVTGCMVRKTGLHPRFYVSSEEVVFHPKTSLDSYMHPIESSSPVSSILEPLRKLVFISDDPGQSSGLPKYKKLGSKNVFNIVSESISGGELQKRKVPKQIERIEDENSLFNSDDGLFGVGDTIDFVFRIEEIQYLTKILSIITGDEIGNDAKSNEYLQIKQFPDNSSLANVIIQTGCDNYCTFCIVPYTRGRELSRPMDEITEEVRRVVDAGAREITLLGQNVNSYGKETKKKLWNAQELKWEASLTKTPFRELLDEIDSVPGLSRIRFTSSNPHDMTKDILDAHFELPRLCNYIHFALQSGSDEVLRAMNRKHTFEDFRLQVEYLRSRDPLFSISTDIIVGFPGETEEQFQETARAFELCEFDFAFIARYSPRKGTRAADNMEDTVSLQEKAKRWDILNTLLYKSTQARAKLMIGRTEEILILGPSKTEGLVGRTRNFKEVYIDASDSIRVGDLVRVKITEIDRWVLKGEVV